MKLVLLLEDNINDKELILRSLKNLVLVCPTSERYEYITALVENKFDMIICDLNVFTFLEFETVTLAKAKQPDTPLIVLTGSMSEKEAENAILVGANLYIMKNGFKTLRDKVKEILKI